MELLLKRDIKDLIEERSILTQFAIEDWFKSIAEELLLGSTLIVQDVQYKFAEVEFYMYCDIHRDLFCRRSPGQLDVAKWHFHRKGNSYREGNYRGLDIAFGNNVYGGILVRSLTRHSDGVLFEGPCVVVNEILSKFQVKSVFELTSLSKYNDDIFQGAMQIVSRERSSETVHRCGRAGLISKGKAYLPFVAAPYRYATSLTRIRKGIQNFVLELYYEGIPASDISQITGCSCNIYYGWIYAFIRGFQSREPPVLSQRPSVEELAQAYGYYKKVYG